MRLLFITIIIIISLSHGSAQSSYWISNNPSDLEVVDFTSFNDALLVISPGDTLMVYNSGISYGSPDISQKVHIIAVGYKVDTINQPELMIETMFSAASFGEIDFLNGSGGSSLQGIAASSIWISNSSNIIVKKCYANKFRIDNSSDIQFISNYVGSGYWWSGYGTCNNALDYRSNAWILGSTDIVLYNNIFSDYHTYNQCHVNRRNLFVDENCGSVVIKNNLFRDHLLVFNSILKNNIFSFWQYTSGISGINMTNNTVGFNTFCGSNSTIPLGNTSGVDCNALFAGGNSFDGQYQLAINSPAVGVGENGVDCGPFDGIFPYKLSGINARPLIYQFHVPEEIPVGNNIDVNIKVRAEN